MRPGCASLVFARSVNAGRTARRSHHGLYDATSLPLVVGRAPSLPADVAITIYDAADPVAATKEYFARHRFARCALSTASATLVRAVDDWVAGKPLRNPKAPLRALAYLVRMASRPTPFGLCAGVGAVKMGETTSLGIDEARSRTFTRPDMGLMLQLAAEIENSSPPGIKYVTNDAVLERGGRLFVVNVGLANRVLTEDGLAASEQRAVSLKNTEAVRLVRKLCERPTSYGAVAAALAGAFEAPLEDARKILDQLVRAGVVISELHPSPVGEPGQALHERFVGLRAPFAPALSAAIDLARKLDGTPIGERDQSEYRRVYEAFAVLTSEPPGNLVQTDLRVQFTGTLGRRIVADAAQLAELYVRCGPVLTLSKLRQRFEERYEGGDRMIPLLELVDPNVGFGLPESAEPTSARTEKRDALLVRIASDALRALSVEVELQRSDLDTLFHETQESDAMPAAVEIGFQVAASSLDAVNAGNYSIVPSGFMGSIGAAKSLGRFAGMLGSDVVDRARVLARSASSPSELVAELAYVPADGRTYNVYARPALYKHEIRVGVGSAQGEAIALDDLWVGLDKGGFYLWSVSRGSRISVRETHLFNTSASAPNLCRFLSLLEAQGTRAIVGFPWGPASTLTYLPRVRTGRIVLSPRRWLLERAICGSGTSAAKGAIDAWRKQWNVPRYVSLAEFDQRLLVDLDSPVAAELVLDQSKSETLHFYEALPDPSRAWIRGACGSYFVEFIASAIRTHRAERHKNEKPIVEHRRKRYGPGSRWTYARIYLGAQALDDHLRSEIAPLIAKLREAGLVDRWFFLRYADPQNHVRLRLRATAGNERVVRERFLALAEEWLETERVVRYALDTYDPEYERYGGAEKIDAIERFFEFDSDRCIGIIETGVTTTDALVEAAVESFDACIRLGALDKAAVAAFGGPSNRRLSPQDRACLKRLSSRRLQVHEMPSMSAIGENLSDLLHLHCNRLGLRHDAELRVAALVRALGIARLARSG